MKPIVDLITWFLEKNFRAKNAVSVFVALIAVVVVYFTSHGSTWVADLDKRGTLAVPIALLNVFVAVYLLCWLLASVWLHFAEKRSERCRRETMAERRELQIRDTLDSLNDWQRSFVLQFIVQGKTQIHEHEIGGFKSVWGSEVEMLVRKGVIIKHRRPDVYEIFPAFRKYLDAHWDPVSGTL